MTPLVAAGSVVQRSRKQSGPRKDYRRIRAPAIIRHLDSDAPVTLSIMGCDFTEPFRHAAPVHHAGTQRPLHEWPDECLGAQLQYERWRQSRDESNYTSTAYLANLENEWAKRRICSRCHRDIDSGLEEQMSELESREHNAADKLGRIRHIMITTPEAGLRPEIMSILDGM